MVAPLVRRQSRALLSLLALALGASLVTTLVTLYQGVENNLNRQFRRYGANLVVTLGPGASAISPQAAEPVLALFPAGAGVRYDVGESQGRQVVVAGADLARLRQLNPEWQVQGPVPQAGEAWLGANAARLLHRGTGSSIDLTLNGHSARWQVVGTVESGGSEDNQIFAPYAAVAALAADPANAGYTTLQLRVAGDASAMSAAVTRVQQLLPAAQARPVRQIAQSQGEVLLSTRSLLLATTILILLTVGLCVAAALTTLALERRRDFGLMKALGGSESRVMAAFVGEAAILGAAAAVVGMAVGSVVAGTMGRALFGLWLAPSALALGAALVLTLGVAAAAALIPWPIVHAATPAAILRGE